MQSGITIKVFENKKVADVSSISQASINNKLFIVPWLLRVLKSSRIYIAICFKFYGLRGYVGFEGFKGFTGFGTTSLLRFMMD